MTPNPSAVTLRSDKRSLTVVLLLAFGFGCSCSRPTVDRAHSIRQLSDPDTVALVGERSISVGALDRALAESPRSVKATLAQLVDARAYGLYADKGGLEHGRRAMVVRAVLARALLERIEAQTKNPPTPTDGEVEAMTAARWIEFDRPEAVRTCHAVVHADHLEPSAGLSLAQRMAEVLRPLTQCKDFIERAKAFPTGGAKVTAESLPPVTPDGRTLVVNADGVPVDEGLPFDEDFARGAHQIKAVGTQSGIINTRFGWHIVLLEARLPAKRVAFDERREALAPEILRQRAKDASERAVAEARQRTRVTLDRASIETVGRVQVDP
jgi:hypothetical protein